MSTHDDDLLRETVNRLLLPIAWLLVNGLTRSLKELARKVMDVLTPAERDAAVKDWAERRMIEAKGVADPAARTLHGLMLLVRPAVEGLRGLGYVTSGTDFNMQFQLEDERWRRSKWGHGIKATCAAFDKARKAVEPLVEDGKLGKAEALSRIRAALPGKWDGVRRGVVADALMEALRPDLNKPRGPGAGRPGPRRQATPSQIFA